jgi:DNA-binding LytR/AlgR family response regulator
MLPGQHFFKIHKSYLVNLSHIQKIERHQVGISNGDVVPLSAVYREVLLDALR